MKPFLTAISLFLGLFSCAQGNAKDSTASCIANWEKGDNKVLLITHSQTKFKSDKLNSVFRFTYEAHISVMSSADNGDTIQWVFQLPEKFKKENPGYENTMQVYNGMKMVFIINKSGSFRELINWEEVKDAYVNMFKASLPKDMDSSTKAGIEKSNAFFNSRDAVEAALIREIQIYHSPFGGNYSTKEKIISTTLSNPFGKDPLPSLITRQITEINPQAGYFKIVLKQEMDSLAMKKLVVEMITKMNPASDTAVNEMKKELEGFNINDRSEFIVLEATGWIKRLLRTRTAIISGTKEIDSYTMEIQKEQGSPPTSINQLY